MWVCLRLRADCMARTRLRVERWGRVGVSGGLPAASRRFRAGTSASPPCGETWINKHEKGPHSISDKLDVCVRVRYGAGERCASALCGRGDVCVWVRYGAGERCASALCGRGDVCVWVRYGAGERCASALCGRGGGLPRHPRRRPRGGAQGAAARRGLPSQVRTNKETRACERARRVASRERVPQ